MRKVILMLMICSVALVGCKSAKQNVANTPGTGVNTPSPMGRSDTTIGSSTTTGRGATGMGITVTSTAFTDSATIPTQYTCEGKDVSLPIAWSGAPGATKSLALIMDDPDAPGGLFTHWVVWNIPPTVTSLDEGLAKNTTVAGMKQGLNSFPKTGYNGPCPPAGKAHRYYFTVLALDDMLNIPDNSDRAALERAMQGHILAQGRMMGMYAKGGASATGTTRGTHATTGKRG